MRILIIGSSGFISKYYKKFSRLKYIKSTSSKKNNKCIYFDILLHDIGNIIDDYKITHVVLFSAISNPLECERNKNLSSKFNVTMTKKILQKLIKKKIYFIFFSSEYIFDGYKGNYSEKSKIGNKLLYGKQKINIEKFLNNKKSNNYSILRLGKTYGDELNDNSIFTSFLKEYMGSKRNFVFAKDQFFNALYVKDLIKVIDFFLKKKITGTFNVCGNESYSRVAYFTKISKKFNLTDINISKKKFQDLSNVLNIPLNVTMINKKIKKILNFKITSFQNYLKIMHEKYGNKFQ